MSAIGAWLEENSDELITLTSIATLIVTVAIAFFAHKINKKIAWYTGAMESHSTLMLRMEAEKNGKKLIWWDPDYRDSPKTQEHGDDAKIDTIRIFLPPEIRLKKRCKK